MKRVIASLLLASMAFGSAFAADSYKLKVATWHAPEHPISNRLLKYAPVSTGFVG